MASARAIAAQLRHGERRALLLIADQADRDQVPPTNVDVAAKLNVSDETGRRFCLRLQNLQLIARLGTGRQGYRPTDLGRAVLQAIKNDLTKKD
jgi:Mn-dependent DtxR family transcriptional regulator